MAKTITENGHVFMLGLQMIFLFLMGLFVLKGLTGLILEVYNQNKTINITMTNIKKSTEEIFPIQYLKPVKVKDKNEFIKARNNYFEDPSIYNGNMKLLDLRGNDKTYTIKEKLKKINVFRLKIFFCCNYS